jgi:(S)-ureidoglycine aminohydrolase
MSIYGTTRSSIARNHALITPESFVRSTLPGWDNSEIVILISPQMGARFAQYLAFMGAGAVAGAVLAPCERVIFVLEGEVVLKLGHQTDQLLTSGGYVYIPPNVPASLQTVTPSRLSVFEKRYQPRSGVAPPALCFGQEQDIEGVPFLGDPDARLQTLLPQEPSFDLAVNLFTFQPGAALPLVEVHVMEHGLLMLEGQGVYRLGDAWYPVQQGDVIWMAPYCPQWFVAMGKGAARYLYYKDVNRDPLEPLK